VRENQVETLVQVLHRVLVSIVTTKKIGPAKSDMWLLHPMLVSEKFNLDVIENVYTIFHCDFNNWQQLNVSLCFVYLLT
jgi:hypothetical protein